MPPQSFLVCPSPKKSITVNRQGNPSDSSRVKSKASILYYSIMKNGIITFVLRDLDFRFKVGEP